MSEILIDHVLLDRVTKDAKESPRLRMNYNTSIVCHCPRGMFTP